jgi:iron complex transport system permease protein
VKRAMAALFILAILAVALGPTGWRVPWDAELSLPLRLPRVVLAASVGACLALAGVVMQALLANDLADPWILGLAGGANAGAVLSLLIFPALPAGPAAAAGAVAAAAIVKALSPAASLPLAGIAVGALLSSLTALFVVLAPPGRLPRGMAHWLFGGLASPGWSALAAPAVAALLGVALLPGQAERLDRLSLGEDVAATLGENVAGQRTLLVALVVGLTAAAVLAAGPMAFVGLIAPHAARRLVGSTHRALLPAAAALGAGLVLFADTAARVAFAPREVPAGLLVAAIGGPLFLLLLRREARAW